MASKISGPSCCALHKSAEQQQARGRFASMAMLRMSGRQGEGAVVSGFAGKASGCDASQLELMRISDSCQVGRRLSQR